MRNRFKKLLVIVIASFIFFNNAMQLDVEGYNITKPAYAGVQEVIFENLTIPPSVAKVDEIIVEAAIEQPEVVLSEEDIQLIALVTMAEAEGESELGKRLVIDTILNRIDSNEFPSDTSGVIYQLNQFTSMWNGRVERVSSNDYICELVKEECFKRTNNEVIYFTAGAYGQYGTPVFSEGNHYFCK